MRCDTILLDNDSIGVYKIESPSGNCYIGMTTVSFNNRWKQHLKDHRLGVGKCVGLHRAIDKYGTQSMNFAVLEDLTGFSEEYIILREQYWWDLHHPWVTVYNGRPSGTGSVIHSAETRSKLRSSLLKYYGSEELKPIPCKCCDIMFMPAKRHTVFCSKSCNAKFHSDNFIRGMGYTPRCDLNTDKIISEYLSGNSLRSISSVVGVSSTTVWNILKDNNIPRRDRRGKTQMP